MRNSPELKNKFKSKLFDILSKKVRYSGKSGTRDFGPAQYCSSGGSSNRSKYIIIFSGAILGGANRDCLDLKLIFKFWRLEFYVKFLKLNL